MGQPIEELEKLEQAWQKIVDLLNQASQDVDQAVAMVTELFNSHKPHPVLESAVNGIEANMTAAIHAHNEVLAQIRAAKADPNYLAAHQE